MASARPQERDFKAARDLSCIENWRLQHFFFFFFGFENDEKRNPGIIFSLNEVWERKKTRWECLLFYLPLFTTWHSAVSLRKPVTKIEQIKVRQYSYSRGRWGAACHTVSGRLVYPPEAAASEYPSCLGLESLLPMNQKVPMYTLPARSEKWPTSHRELNLIHHPQASQLNIFYLRHLRDA